MNKKHLILASLFLFTFLLMCLGYVGYSFLHKDNQYITFLDVKKLNPEDEVENGIGFISTGSQTTSSYVGEIITIDQEAATITILQDTQSSETISGRYTQITNYYDFSKIDPENENTIIEKIVKLKLDDFIKGDTVILEINNEDSTIMGVYKQ